MLKLFNYFKYLLLLLLFLLIYTSPVKAFVNSSQGTPSFAEYEFVVNIFRPDIQDETESRKVVEFEKFMISIQAYNVSTRQQEKDFFKGKRYFLTFTNPDGAPCVAEENTDPNFPIVDTNIISTYLLELNHGDPNNGDIYRQITPSSLNGLILGDFGGGSNACANFKAGPWLLRVYQSTPSISNLMIKDLPFEIKAAQGGSSASIEPVGTQAVDKIICGNRVTQVKLVNGVKGVPYTFWWDGAKSSAAAYFTPTENNATNVINLSGNDLDTSKENIRLCMQEGSLRRITLIAWGRCDTVGKFLEFQQPKSPTACLQPSQSSCVLQHTSVDSPGQFKITLTATKLDPSLTYGASIVNSLTNTTALTKTLTVDTNGTSLLDAGLHPAGDYTYVVSDSTGKTVCSETKKVSTETLTSLGRPAGPDAKCVPGAKDCAQAGGQRCNPKDGSKSFDSSNPGILTAIGCVPTRPKALVEGILKFVSFIGGGIALLLMILGSLQMITTEGNPELIKAAQEKFYSAIIGLLIIIFSVLFLQVLGVDILNLPGFS